AAQCWSGGTPGAGVPRESLLVVNRTPFPVKVMAGPANGTRRVLGEVPARSSLSFLAVLPPGRNETVVWADPEVSRPHGVASARVAGRVVIVKRGELTCRRFARLEVTTGVFAAARRTPARRDVARGRAQDLSR